MLEIGGRKGSGFSGVQAWIAFTAGLLLSQGAAADVSTVTVGNASATVLNGGNGTMSFPVTRTGDTSYEAAVSYTTQNGSALAGTDYTASSGTLLIPAGSTNATIQVPLTGEAAPQANKQFSLSLLGAAGVGPAVAFNPHADFTTGLVPVAVAIADLNGDGKPDLIVANNDAATISVFVNTTAPGAATPSYAAQQTFAVGNGPLALAIGDLNGDGKPDVVVANYQDNDISTFINATTPGSSTISLVNQRTYSAYPPQAVALADINGDGRLDMVFVNSSRNSVTILLNTTAPGATATSFGPENNFSTGNTPQTLAILDANGDGKPDLAIGNAGDGTVSVLLNTTVPGATTANFASQRTFSTGADPDALAAVDVNGDGLPDLVVANAVDDTVSVLLNTTAPGAASASFFTQQVFATGSYPSSIVAQDINGDGKPDLLLVDNSDQTVKVLLNITADGDFMAGFFNTGGGFTAGNDPIALAVGDLNGDGQPDVAVVNENSTSVSVLLNATASVAAVPNFTSAAVFATGQNPFAVALGDFNGDGKPDIVVPNSSDDTVSVLLNNAAPGAAMPSFGSQHTFATGPDPKGVAVGDVNGDGRPDIVVVNESTAGTVSVLINATVPGSATPSFAAQQTFTAEDNPESSSESANTVVLADVNGDGKPDIVIASEVGVTVLLNTTVTGASVASFAAQQTFITSVESSNGVAVADVNGDGKPDIVLVASNGVTVLINTTTAGAGTVSLTQHLIGVPDSAYSIAIGDVNGDGKPDIVIGDDVLGGPVLVYLNTTATGAAAPSFAAVQPFAPGSNPDDASTSVFLADINGDGRPDIVVGTFQSSVVVLPNTTAPGATTAAFGPPLILSAAGSAVAVAAGDVNGDGKPDIVSANGGVEGESSVSVLLNTQYQVTASATPGTGTISYSSTAPPPAPTGVTATPGNAQVSLSWTASAGATSYSVFKGTSAGGESTTAVASGISGTSTVITGLTNGTKYYFTVKAVNGSNTSPASAEVSATPVVPLAAPTNVSAVAGNARVQLSWTAVSGATQYVIYDGTTSGGESGAPAGITTSTTAAVTSLSNGTKYYFTVKAYNSTSGYSPASSEVSATPAAVPAAPTGVAATAGSAQVSLSWTAVSGATSYNVYEGTSSGGESATAAASGITGTSSVITGLSNGTKYYFTVKAVNSNGAGAASAEVSATPVLTLAAPTGVSAVAGNARVQVSWTAVSGATQYVIYDGTTSGGESGAPAGITTSTTAAVTSLTNGTKYYFTVKAYNSTSGYSSASTEVSATPVVGLAAPTGVGAVAGNARVQVSWTAVAGATEYVIYDATSSGAETGTPAGITTSTTAAITSLTNGTKYYFTVKAYNSTSGYSSASTEVSATPAVGLAAPTGVSAVAGNARVQVSWTAVAGATEYVIYDATSSGAETGTPAGITTATTAAVTSLTNGTKYYFTVKAYNSTSGYSSASSEVSATPEP